jgi:hypothetical protein
MQPAAGVYVLVLQAKASTKYKAFLLLSPSFLLHAATLLLIQKYQVSSYVLFFSAPEMFTYYATCALVFASLSLYLEIMAISVNESSLLFTCTSAAC